MKQKESNKGKLSLEKIKITKITNLNVIKGGDGETGSSGDEWTTPTTAKK